MSELKVSEKINFSNLHATYSNFNYIVLSKVISNNGNIVCTWVQEVTGIMEVFTISLSRTFKIVIQQFPFVEVTVKAVNPLIM